VQSFGGINHVSDAHQTQARYQAVVFRMELIFLNAQLIQVENSPNLGWDVSSACLDALYSYKAAVEAQLDEALVALKEGISSPTTFFASSGKIQTDARKDSRQQCCRRTGECCNICKHCAPLKQSRLLHSLIRLGVANLSRSLAGAKLRASDRRVKAGEATAQRRPQGRA